MVSDVEGAWDGEEKNHAAVRVLLLLCLDRTVNDDDVAPHDRLGLVEVRTILYKTSLACDSSQKLCVWLCLTV